MKFKINQRVWILAVFLFSSLLSFSQNLFISGGNVHSAAICANGTVYVWGNNSSSQLGPNGGALTYSANPILVPGAGTYVTASQVDAGSGAHTVLLACDKTVWTWGLNNWGQLGNGSSGTNSATPVQVLAGETGAGVLQNVVYVSGGNDGTFAILQSGELVSWGQNDKGQLGNGTYTNSSTPVYVKVNSSTHLTNVIQVEAGDETAYALVDPDGDGIGTVYSWGAGTGTFGAKGMLGRDVTGTSNSGTESTNDNYARPVINLDGSQLSNIVSISAGDGSCLALDVDGYIWIWGNGGWGGLTGQGVGVSDHSDPRRVVAGEWATVTGNGETYLKAKSIAGGQGFNMAVTTDGIPVAWGNNGACAVGVSGGHLGNGGGAASNAPVIIRRSAGTYDNNVVSISDGDTWGFYLTSDNAIYAWGNNGEGYLGIGNTTCQNYATQLTLPSCTFPAPQPSATISPRNFSICPVNTGTIINSGFVVSAALASDYSVTWYKDGVSVATGDGSLNTYTVTQAGTYKVKIEYVGTDSPCSTYNPSEDQITVTELLPDFRDPIIDTPVDTNFVGAVRIDETGINSTETGNKYAWYATPTSPTILGFSNDEADLTTIDFSVLTPTATVPKTYYTLYVADSTLKTGMVFKQSQSCNPSFNEQEYYRSNNNESSDPPSQTQFIAYKPITLTQVKISVLVDMYDATGSVVSGRLNFGVYGTKTNNGGPVADESQLLGSFYVDISKTKPAGYTAAYQIYTVSIPDIAIPGNAAGYSFFISPKRITLTNKTGNGAFKIGSTNCTPSPLPIWDDLDGATVSRNGMSSQFQNPQTGGNLKGGYFFDLSFEKRSDYLCERIPILVYVPPCDRPTNVVVSGTPLTFCSGGSVTLTANPTPASPSSGTYLYQWYNGSTAIGAATASTYIANASGDYKVRVGHTTVSDPACYFESSISTVTVHTPVSSNTISGGSSICPGGSAASLTGSTPSGGVGSPTYQWVSSASATGPWTVIGAGTSKDYSPGAVASTTYYRRIVTSAGTCPEDTSVVQTVTVSTPPADIPVLTVTNNCGNSDIDPGTAPVGVTYYWQTADGGTSTATAASGSRNVAADGPYYIRARLDASPNCWSTNTRVVPVTIVNAPADVPLPTVTNNCGNSDITPAAAPAGVTYYWQTADGGTSTALVVSGVRNVTADGPYYIRARLDTSPNCWSVNTRSIPVTIVNAPSAVPSPTVTNNCGNSDITLSAATSGVTYYWQTADGGTSTTTVASGTTNVTVDGPYYVRARMDAAPNCWSVNTTTIPVTIKVIPSDPSTPTGASPACPSSSLTVAAAPAGVTYYWQGTTSAGTSTASNASSAYTASSTGTYYVRAQDNTSLCWSTGSSSIAITINALNPGSVSADETVCESATPTDISAGAATGGDGVNYIYDWESSTDNATFSSTGVTTQNYSFSGPITQTMYYRRKVTSGTCSNYTTAITKTFSPLPGAAGAISGSNTVCANSTGKVYSITAVANATSYNWSLPVGATITSGNNTNSITVTFGTNSGTITVTPVNSCGNGTGNNLAVTVDPVVSVSVSINDPGPTCAGDLMIFTASPVNEGSSPSYQWLVDGNPVATGNPFSTASLSNGNQVKAVLTSSIACTSGSPATSNTITVSVSSNVTPSITLSGPASICSDSIATYTASSSGGGGSPTYQWILDGSNYGAPTSSNTFSNPLLSSGSHNVQVLMTTSLTCATSSTATSNTISIDVKTIPSPSVNESDTTVCSGNTLTLTSSSGGGTLQWYKDGVLAATGSSYSVPTSVAGSFSITVNENNGACNTTSSSVTVNVVSTPVAFAGPDLHVTEGETVTLNASGGTFYTWSPAAGLSDPAIANPTVTPTGLMVLTVTVSNGGLCYSSDEMTIYVIKPVLIPNAFSPNGDNIHDVFILKNIDVYPEAVLSVYNQWGELIYKSDPGYPEPWDGTRNGKPVPVSAYVYVLELNSPDVEDITGSVTILK